MRVIAGTFGGRIFQSPHGRRTHPMSDKMRGALFNILGDITDCTVLDAFSGTGALSFEAVSRGAASAVAIEIDRNAQRTIQANIQSLDIDNVKLIRANARAWLGTSTDVFDIVLLDPPYDNVQLSLLEELVARTSSGGTVVLSWPSGTEPPQLGPLELKSSKQYGDGSLHVYR